MTASLQRSGAPVTAPAAPVAPTPPATRMARLVPVVVLPLADLAGLAAAALLAGVPVGWAVLYVAVLLGLLRADGQHRLRICRRVSDQLPRTVAAVATALPMVLAVAGGAACLRLGLYSVALLCTLRAGACAGMRSAHRRGRLLEPTLLVGTGATAVRLAQLLGGQPVLGLAPRGFLDSRQPAHPTPLPVLGGPGELAATVRAHGIQRVIVCFPAVSDADVVPLLRACRPLPADVCLVPRLYELGVALPRGCLDELWGIPLVPLRRLGHHRAALAAKGALDRALATVLLVACTPLLLALAAVIRGRGGQGALFRQVRVSTAGRSVPVLKLRTMLPHPDSDTRWAVPGEYTSRFDRWLRATHLDELPQLVNVVCGQMSLVGPRPERPHFAARFGAQIPRYPDRLRMPAGMTGWAQIHGLHGDTSVSDRARFDNQYIEYWSLWLDLVILVRTLGTLRAPPPAGQEATPSSAQPVPTSGGRECGSCT